MMIAEANTIRRAGRWVGGVLDAWMPPGDVPEGAASWDPDPATAYCPRCGATIDAGGVTARGCVFCHKHKVPWQRLTRLAAYDAPVDEWVRQMKFQRRWAYGRWLGRKLAEALDGPGPGEGRIVCAVPMHRIRRWRRGYNQADVIGRAVAQRRGWRFAPVLQRTRHTPPQTAIAPSRRHDNVRHSFALAAVDLAGHEVILVDDVKTSGATLTACTRLLQAAGARSVYAAVVAVADPKGQDFTVA